MQYVRKILAIVLTLTLVLGMVPATAFAQEVSTQDVSDFSMTGSDGLGNLISQEINAYQESTESESEEYEGGFGISDLTISGNTATVRYCTLEKASLVVALYTEDGMQMLSSASVSVEPGTVEASVTFEGDMPEYFQAAVFLLDTYDLAPLCPAYRTSIYTREMQELLDSTVADYDADQVINLDDNSSTNFLVCNDTTTIIEYREGHNKVLQANDETATYVIENPDAQIKNLRPGDVAVYQYDTDRVLVVKVDTITTDGNTATITGDEVDLEEVFDYVKIDGSGGSADAILDESQLDEGVTLAGSSGSRTRASAEGDGEFGFTFNLNIAKTGDDDKNIKATGGVDVGVQFDIKLYITKSYKMVDIQVELNAKFNINVEAKYGGSCEAKLGKWKIPVCTMIGIEFTPKFFLQISGSAQFTATYGRKDGILMEHDSNGWRFSPTEEKPTWSFETEFEGTIFAGVKLTPDVQVLQGLLANAEFDVVGGVYFDAKIKVEPITNDDIIHECTGCIDGDFGLNVKFSITLRLLKSKKLEVGVTILDAKLKMADYYICIEHGVAFALGNCPHNLYKLTVQVVDEDGNSVDDATVRITSKEPEYEEELDGGTVITYLRQAEYHVTASGSGGYDSARAEIHSPQMLLLTLKDDEDDEDEHDGNILDSVEPDSVIDGGTITAEGESGGIRWILYESGLMLFVGSGKMNLYQGSKTPWHNYMSQIRYVFIQDGITNLQEFAFLDAKNLEHIDFPDSIVSIGNSACKNCRSLTTIEWSANLNSIGSEAFRGTNIAALSIPDSLSSVGGSAFKGCNALTTVNIGGPDLVVGTNAFESCKALTSVTIGDGTIQLDDKSFYNCKSLSTVTLADTVVHIGVAAFAENEALTSVTMSRGIEEIEMNAFVGCPNLTYISSFHSVQVIGNSAFSGTGLSYLDLPNSMDEIRYGTFSGMPNLTSVTIDASELIIREKAFEKCAKLETVEITGHVQLIDDYAFSNCSALKSVILPDQLEKMQGNVFKNCSSLEQVGTASESNTLPESLSGTEIGASTFYGCSALKKIILPEGITSIGSSAFDQSGLESIIVPASVKTIGGGAFKNCVELKTVTIHSESTVIMDDVFSDCEKLSSVTLDEGITRIGSYAFQNCLELGSITIPNTVTRIDECAFKGCEKLSYISLSNSLTAISASLFSGCTELSSVTIPDSVTKIGKYILGGTEVSSITIPAAVTTIESYAFDSLENLHSVRFEGSKPAIGKNAFNQTVCTVSYPSGDESWAGIEEEDYGGDLTWSASSSVKSDVKMARGGGQIHTCATTDNALNDAITKPTLKAAYGGSYNAEQVQDQIIRTASFQNLVPGGEYVLLVLESLEASDPLTAANLLFIDQAAAGEDGSLSFRYIQREEMDISYVLVCGPSGRNLADAVITFPEMIAGTDVQAVKPIVIYEGKTLAAGTDYVVLGNTSYTAAGTYTCYIRGIHNYTGIVECTYIVSAGDGITGDFNADGTVDDGDVAYLLWNTLFTDMYPISIPADFTGDGNVDDADVAYLLWHTLFPDAYPLS